MSHNNLKYLGKELERASATMIGSSLAGFCCVSTAIQLGFVAKGGIPIAILLASLNASLIYRACGDSDETIKEIPLACRIIGFVIRLIVPLIFLFLGVYSAYVCGNIE